MLIARSLGRRREGVIRKLWIRRRRYGLMRLTPFLSELKKCTLSTTLITSPTS